MYNDPVADLTHIYSVVREGARYKPVVKRYQTKNFAPPPEGQSSLPPTMHWHHVIRTASWRGRQKDSKNATRNTEPALWLTLLLLFLQFRTQPHPRGAWQQLQLCAVRFLLATEPRYNGFKMDHGSRHR
jgi:hypothetical protein